VTVKPATNRITTAGYGYDANGNLTSMPLLTLSYDIENRLVQATSSLNGTEYYVYDPGNQRVWKEGKVYFYGVEGNLLGTYGDGSNTDYNVYFGGKLIWQEAAAGLAAHPVNADRLSSTVKHFPYGEEPTTTTQDRTKFAAYYRDATTALDYARNRYYARTIGRFTSPDRSGRNESLTDPASFNRYTYVNGDPINFIDPSGQWWLFNALADAWDAMSGWGGSLFGWQRKPDLTSDYDSWMAGWEMLEKLQPDPTSYGVAMKITYSDGQTEDLGFDTHPFQQETTPPAKNTMPPTENPWPDIPPVTFSFAIPYPPVPVIGFQVSATVIPNTPKGNRFCLGVGPAVGLPLAAGFSGGPLVVGEGTDAESVVRGLGWSSSTVAVGLGAQLVGSGAGQLPGLTFGMRGATLSAGFTACMPMPRLPSLGRSTRTR
jgi:RHS repeat-associated protein